MSAKGAKGAERADVVVIGAGPAGSSASAILAAHGRRVIVLERETFPRYRIGESLIPYTWFPLERLGMNPKIAESGCRVAKLSVQFVTTDGRQTLPFYFFKHTDHPCAHTWQVVRSAFDRLLVENAIERGADVRFGWLARDLLRDERGQVTGVRAKDGDGVEREISAPITIDASGRDVFAGGLNGWRVPDPRLKKIAVWTYWRGALRDPGIDEGATTIAYLPGKGWFWYIPLPEDKVSVGIVAERDYLYRDLGTGERDPERIFMREVGVQRWVQDHLAPGERCEGFRVTGDYSYRCRHCAEDGLILAGDAFAFLDPVFSSGVFLALFSGVHAGDAAHAALDAQDVSAGRFATYGERFCRAIEAMRRLVYTFYDVDFSFSTFVADHPHLRKDLTDCLIGNVEYDLEPLFRTISGYADLPAPIEHGRPLVAGGGATVRSGGAGAG